ncbi:MAG: hypothetical protein Q9162_004342 [Coniocarpon cinnabarinum]
MTSEGRAQIQKTQLPIAINFLDPKELQWPCQFDILDFLEKVPSIADQPLDPDLYANYDVGNETEVIQLAQGYFELIIKKLVTRMPSSSKNSIVAFKYQDSVKNGESSCIPDVVIKQDGHFRAAIEYKTTNSINFIGNNGVDDKGLNKEWTLCDASDIKAAQERLQSTGESGRSLLEHDKITNQSRYLIQQMIHEAGKFITFNTVGTLMIIED